MIRREFALALLLVLLCPRPLMADHIVAVSKQIEASRHQPGRTLTVLCTAYCYTGKQTYTRTWPQDGRTVAVDPRYIPLGSKVTIDGHRYIAEDTGRLIRGPRVDIYISGKRQATEYGAKWKGIEVQP